MTSCIPNECEVKIENEYPEITEYIETHDLAKHTELICSSDQHDSYTFNGYQEPKGKCFFFDVTLEVGKVMISTFTFQIDGTRQYDILVYEFENDEDLVKFKKFIPDATLYYEKNKEIHEFFESEDKVFLYYYGFP